MAAVADVHSPQYLDEFSNSLSECKKPDLFLLAGDMIGSRNASEYGRVVDAIESQLGRIPIIACHGNEERKQLRNEILPSFDDRVRFLDEEISRFEVGQTRLGVVGVSTMIADRAASGTTDIGPVEAAFAKRIERLSKLLSSLAKTSTCTILLMHYNPLAEAGVARGSADTFSWWVSKCVEGTKPDLVLHGHIHSTDRLETTIGNTRIVNVAFPASGKVTMLNL